MFAENLRQLRREKKLTQIELGHILNVSNGTIAMWETNKRKPDFETICMIAKNFNVSVDFLMGIEKSKAVKIPVLGIIPAGIPIEAVENILDYEEISEDLAKRGDYFALKVSGDSMLPTIKEGDIVIVRQQDNAESGKICVVLINGYDATLKEIRKSSDGIWILPHNPNSNFKPTFYSNEDIKKLPIRILGIAVEIRRSL